jgi:hypothetical protein
MLKKTRCFEDTALNIVTVIAVPDIGAGASVAGRYMVDAPGHITSFTPH